MASNEISWESAFWSITPYAINSMVQPSGRIFGFDPSLGTYLRISPIVCVTDAVTVVIRFVVHIWRLGLPVSVAARKVMSARRRGVEDAEPGGIQALENNLYLRCVWGVIGVLPQIIKLMACSGLPWTKAWVCFYVVSFFIMEVMNYLADSAPDWPESAGKDSWEDWVDGCDQVCGAVAILFQLCLLAWIDLAAVHLDPILISRWAYRLLRLCANFGTFLVHIPFMRLVIAIQSDAPMESCNRHLRDFLISMLVIFCVILAGFEGHHFSFLYFIISFVISFFAWLLYFIPVAKTHVLLCEPGNRRPGWNVLAFDFFCRTLCLSLLWYSKHYDPTKTFKPGWAQVFG